MRCFDTSQQYHAWILKIVTNLQNNENPLTHTRTGHRIELVRTETRSEGHLYHKGSILFWSQKDVLFKQWDLVRSRGNLEWISKEGMKLWVNVYYCLGHDHAKDPSASLWSEFQCWQCAQTSHCGFLLHPDINLRLLPYKRPLPSLANPSPCAIYKKAWCSGLLCVVGAAPSERAQSTWSWLFYTCVCMSVLSSFLCHPGSFHGLSQAGVGGLELFVSCLHSEF